MFGKGEQGPVGRKHIVMRPCRTSQSIEQSPLSPLLESDRISFQAILLTTSHQPGLRANTTQIVSGESSCARGAVEEPFPRHERRAWLDHDDGQSTHRAVGPNLGTEEAEAEGRGTGVAMRM